jgi:hypothetical protein
MNAGTVLEIKSGFHKGSWIMTHATGFGSQETSARFQRLGKSGKILRNDSMNLSKDELDKAIAQ